MFKGHYFDRTMILRDLEETMAERAISIGQAAVHRCTVHCAPLLLEQFDRGKRAVS
jgi:putative transposase